MQYLYNIFNLNSNFISSNKKKIIKKCLVIYGFNLYNYINNFEEESFHSEHPGGWIEWFCLMEDHLFLCEVDETFILCAVNSEDLIN